MGDKQVVKKNLMSMNGSKVKGYACISEFIIIREV